ncbi:hypothetical protein G8759_18390 [Spirosoma aureum]|uniref:Uncharacterized protein n=1 Tax=Spirosoma aureum TaxID=2692134 RepID=A0A6G9AQ94_9BACT|nr:hypothetical protein [Spirosoma aureum]QIP14445.1 hypothetical protein G8759_18390 [Spirosoma aureum]
MSAKNFYQTLYQNDQLFRVSNDSWNLGNGQSTPTLIADEVISLSEETTDIPLIQDTTDLLAELDALAAAPITTPAAATTPDSIPIVVSETAIAPEVIIENEPVSIIATPEPLPQAIPRPTTPSITPPIQQVRMPQLNHKVLLLADEELDPSNLLFLEKILKAVNLNIDGVDLLNLHGARDLDFAELVQDKKIHHFITFGVPFNRIHLDIAMDRYQPIRFFGITFLMADSLPTIEADQNLKKRLWGALQRIFLQR